MKKTLLAVSVLSTLLMAGTANAWTEAVDGTFSGQLDFNGTITDTNPNWKWQIPTATSSAITDVAFLKLNGVVSNGNSVFTKVGSLIILEGGMVTPAIHGAPGLTPVVTIGGEIMDPSKAQELNLAVQTGGADSGTLSMTVNSALTLIVNKADGTPQGWNVRTVSSGPAVNSAWTTMTGAIGFADTWVAGVPSMYSSSVADVETRMGGAVTDDTAMLSAFAAELTTYSLTFPSNAIPNTWNAIVPMMVTMK